MQVTDVPLVALGTRGTRLWYAMTALREMGPHEVVQIEEACRIADRLDRLDQLLRGDEDFWARIEWDVRKREVTLVIDDALAESRQQANTLRQIILGLKLPETIATTGVRSLEQQLADARAARIAAGRVPAAPDRVGTSPA